MLLCPSDEASRPLLGRCVSLLYWCEDRPLGPAAFYSPESNKSMAYCSLYCTQQSFSLKHTHMHSHTFSILYTKGGIYKKATLWPSVVHCKQHNLTRKEGICILNLSLPCIFCLVYAWVHVVKRRCVQFLWIIFNSLQSASRGHSQHSVQTDSTHTHSHVNTHTDTHRRQLSITTQGRGWTSESTGGGSWKRGRDMQRVGWEEKEAEY